MKSKHLLRLIIALAVLAVVAKCSQKHSAAPKTADAGKFLDFDLNAVEQFTLTSGTQAVTVAKSEGTWVVRSLWDYPADFGQVADNLRKLNDLKGDAIRGGENQLGEFGLVSTNAEYLAIRFLGAGSKELGTVEMGSPHMGAAGGYPDGQYVRAGSGAILLVNEYLGGFPRRPEDWIQKELLKIRAEDVSYVMVSRQDAAPYGLISEAGGAWKLIDLKDDETMNAETARNVAGALSFLDLDTVADPSNAPETSGNTFVARTTNGTAYTISSRENYARIAVAYDGSDTNELARAQAENERFAKWVYVLPENAGRNLTLAREQLVTIKTNAAGTTTTTTQSPASPTPAN